MILRGGGTAIPVFDPRHRLEDDFPMPEPPRHYEVFRRLDPANNDQMFNDLALRLILAEERWP